MNSNMNPPIRKLVIVIGGSGFVGRHLVSRLLEYYRSVVIFDLVKPVFFDNRVDYVQGDIREFEKIFPISEREFDVVHLAAIHRDDVKNIDDYFSVNEYGTSCIMESINRFAPDAVVRLVFLSSVAVYSNTPYGKSKLAAEEILERKMTTGMKGKVYILRPSAVFGPHCGGNMKLFKAVSRVPILALPGGHQIKSVTSVWFLVSAILRCLIDKRFKGGNWNVVSEPQINVAELLASQRAEGGPRLPILWLNKNLCDTVFWLIGLLLGRLNGWKILKKRYEKFTSSTLFANEFPTDQGNYPRHTICKDLIKWRHEDR